MYQSNTKGPCMPRLLRCQLPSCDRNLRPHTWAIHFGKALLPSFKLHGSTTPQLDNNYANSIFLCGNVSPMVPCMLPGGTRASCRP